MGWKSRERVQEVKGLFSFSVGLSEEGSYRFEFYYIFVIKQVFFINILKGLIFLLYINQPPKRTSCSFSYLSLKVASMHPRLSRNPRRMLISPT